MLASRSQLCDVLLEPQYHFLAIIYVLLRLHLCFFLCVGLLGLLCLQGRGSFGSGGLAGDEDGLYRLPITQLNAHLLRNELENVFLESERLGRQVTWM